MRPLLHAQARLARALRLCIVVYRAAQRTDEARKVSFRRKTKHEHSTVDATHATHAWSTTQHTRAHQRGRFLRPLLHAQTRLARALRLCIELLSATDRREARKVSFRRKTKHEHC